MNKLIQQENLFFIKTKKQAINYYLHFIDRKRIIVSQKKISLDIVTDNIFIINLPSDKIKKEIIKNRLLKNNIENYKFIDGIIPTGKELILFKEIKKDLNPLGRINYIGELGCFLSHKKIWEKCIKENLNNCLIFEDDIFFHKNFQDILESNLQVFDEFDIVFMGSNQSIFSNKINKDINNNFKLNKNYYSCNHLIGEKNIYSYGTFGYFIKQKTIQIFLNEMNLPNFKWRTVDTFIQDTIEKYKLKSCTFYPNLVISDVSKSSIREGRDFLNFSIDRRWNLPYYDFTNFH